MVNYKEILRLLHEECSQREIERILHTSKRKIREFLTAAEAHNLTWPLDESVTNEQIEAILFPERYSAVSMYLEPDYPYIHAELAKRGVEVNLNTRAKEIKADGVIGETAGGEKFFAADTVIYAVGQRPMAEDALALRFCAPEFYQIGDCLAPKNITNATGSAFAIARDIGRI